MAPETEPNTSVVHAEEASSEKNAMCLLLLFVYTPLKRRKSGVDVVASPRLGIILYVGVWKESLADLRGDST